MIDRIQAMRLFMRIVETNSFSRGAESLDVPRTTATYTVQQLEAALGTQLLLRTTRRVSVTAEGAAYYERCAQILAELDELEATMRQGLGSPRGHLRVEMPGAIATAIVLPALGDFLQRYPEIDVEISVNHRAVDLIHDAVDCRIELGDLPDSGLVARRLGTLELLTCASPEYLTRRGVPNNVDDLSEHVAVNCGTPIHGGGAFELNIDGRSQVVDVAGAVQVNDGHVYLTCGLQGLGLIQPARIVAQPLIDAGLLREVLPHYKPTPIPVSVTYIKHRHLSARLRVFVDWSVEIFSQAEHVEADMLRVRQLMQVELSST